MKHTGPVIEVRNLSKSYPTGFWRKRTRILSDLSFTVGRNEIVGFLGPNGAGKTTTIKILNGLAFPDSGTVTVFGEEAGRHPGSRRRIGFMPEQPYFYEYLTGGEFLAFCGRLNGLDAGEIGRRSGEMMTRVGLSDAARMSIRKYSKGMLQRLGLAQALLHDPELIILDEPMSGLDPMGRIEIRNLIRELKDAGKTVFFSSHIISDVEALCDRVVTIHRGKKVAEGSVEELAKKEGIQYVEVVFSPPPPPGWASGAGLPPGSVSERGDTFLLRARDHADANHWIGEFRRVGSLVTSCIPVKKRLEEIYMEQVGGNPKGAGVGE